MLALDVATDWNPELHIFSGDNVYADTTDTDLTRTRHQELADAPEFQRLSAGAQLIATRDDHDHGANDAGKLCPMKEASKAIFLEFFLFHEPAGSPALAPRPARAKGDTSHFR